MALLGGFFSVSFHENLLGFKVLEVKEHHGDVHFAIGGDQGAVHGPGVPVSGHQTISFVNISSKSVDSTNCSKK